MTYFFKLVPQLYATKQRSIYFFNSKRDFIIIFNLCVPVYWSSLINNVVFLPYKFMNSLLVIYIWNEREVVNFILMSTHRLSSCAFLLQWNSYAKMQRELSATKPAERSIFKLFVQLNNFFGKIKRYCMYPIFIYIVKLV